MTTHNTLMTRLRHLGHSDPDDTSWRAICSLLTHFEQAFDILQDRARHGYLYARLRLGT